MSVFYGLLYQYFSIQGNAELFHKPKIIFAMFVFAFLYPAPLIILEAFNVDHQGAQLYVQTQAPFAYDLFLKGACDMTQENVTATIWQVGVVIQMGVIYTVAILFAWKNTRKFKEFRHSMSQASAKAHKLMFFALLVQLMVPFIFIVIPIGGLLACIALGIGNATGFSFTPVKVP